MMQFGGGGLRSVVKIAGVVALACSSPTICAQSSASHSASSSVGDELVQTCGVSDGDKAFGIQVIDDATCADGGLGCYNDHCRYCKVLDTLKSTHLESCEALGADFPSMAPLAISTGSCGVSSGDAVVGVGGMTDPSCLYGGIGCFSDHCRFCQTEPTSQSSQFVKCSWVEGAGGNDLSFPNSDSGDAIDSPTNDAKTTASGPSDPEESVAFETGSGRLCNMTASGGDVAVGISITTDTSCATGGIGCIDSVCRFCRATNTTQSAHLNACAVTTKLCTTTVSEGDAAVGINIVTDATCANGGLGCIDSLCRFCRATTTPQSTAFIDCTSIGGSTSSTSASPSTLVPMTTAPVVTVAPVTPAPAAAPTPTATATIKQVCTQTVSDGDAAVGIKIVTDKSCATGGLGCLDQACRFCRATTTAQSAAFVDCASIEGATITPEPTTAAPTKTPAPSTAARTTDPPTQTPAPTTAAPTIPAVTTSTPVSAASSGVCSITAAAGDVVAGISIVTDASCASGGLGCIDSVCRFCRLTATTQSASYLDCVTISGAGTQTPAVTTPTPAPTPTPTPSATSTTVSTTPSIVFECSRTVSSGDKGVGLDVVSDIRCSEGGTGCLDDVCRFCKRFDTTQSQSYLNCSSIPSADVGSDITFVLIPVVDDSETPTRRLTAGSAADSSENLSGTDINTTSASSTGSSYETLEATTTSTCAMTVSAGDAAVGINIVTDSSCATGGTGCIDSVCRYCKMKDTAQAAHLTSCPPITVAAVSTANVCTSTVADGDAAFGINIITDPRCANGGLGCVDSVCRLCKTKSTDQSAHLGSCSEYSAASTSPTTTAPTASPAPSSAATTSAPVFTTSTYSIALDCYQTASNGDKSLGLDIVTDIRCGDGGVGCVDSICRFCKRFETTQSHSYMKCSDIPSSDNGADINFKTITAIESPQESGSAESIVSLHESAEFTSKADDVCADVLLADGQAAGGIGVVLDTAHCPEGLASGCIGDAGCRYCMRFPTNTSEYLEYCAVVNGTSVAYDVSGITISIEGGSNLSDDESSSRRLDEVPSAISVEEKAPNSDLLKRTTADLVTGGVACVGAIAVVVLAAFGAKRTIRRLLSPSVPAIEKVSPDNENRASVLITSNVGEPGDIRDV